MALTNETTFSGHNYKADYKYKVTTGLKANGEVQIKEIRSEGDDWEPLLEINFSILLDSYEMGKRKHLKMVTPYNTYQIKGLPVGPIANPGAKSLSAALNPSYSEYLFFVSKKDTTHKFSKTIQEHNKAVRKYQLRKK